MRCIAENAPVARVRSMKGCFLLMRRCFFLKGNRVMRFLNPNIVLWLRRVVAAIMRAKHLYEGRIALVFMRFSLSCGRRVLLDFFLPLGDSKPTGLRCV